MLNAFSLHLGGDRHEPLFLLRKSLQRSGMPLTLNLHLSQRSNLMKVMKGAQAQCQLVESKVPYQEALCV